jgi:hypothetical protein
LISSGSGCSGAGESVKNYEKCNPGADIVQAILAIDPDVTISVSGGSVVVNCIPLEPPPHTVKVYYSSPGMRVPADITREMILAKQAELNAICSADPTTLKYNSVEEEMDVKCGGRAYDPRVKTGCVERLF